MTGSVGNVRPRRATSRRVAAVLVTAVLAVSLGWLARAPYQPPGAGDAVLRLSWRLRAPAAELCRPRTQAELEALPVHMRAPQVCERRIATYDLILQIDSMAADTARMMQGGAKGDRPLYVLRELALEPGPHRIRVRFTPSHDLTAASSAAPLALDTVLHMYSGAVALVTLAPDANTFIVRRSTQ
jgi:hypothetical protein